jgi:hypothetical protein
MYNVYPHWNLHRGSWGHRPAGGARQRNSEYGTCSTGGGAISDAAPFSGDIRTFSQPPCRPAEFKFTPAEFSAASYGCADSETEFADPAAEFQTGSITNTRSSLITACSCEKP